MEDKISTVPIHRKMTLTAREAAEYSNIGINKIDSMLRTSNCPFGFSAYRQKKTFPRKGKSSFHKKRKQRTHGKTGCELLVQFGAHRAFLHGAVSFYKSGIFS